VNTEDLALDGTAYTAPAFTSQDADRAPKLAERLAAKVEQEILRSGWPVGEVIGNEPELITRFGVSRAIFREAVRILENHGVVEMRRGPGGGLVITSPDGGAITQAAALYLAYKGASTASLLETRLALEVSCAERAAQKIDEAGIKRLRNVLRTEAARERPWHHSHELHNEIASIAANPVFELFVDVLLSLTERHLRRLVDNMVATGADPRDLIEESRRAHHAIVEAIVGGDAALARHRMQRHIEGIQPYLLRPNGAF